MVNLTDRRLGLLTEQICLLRAAFRSVLARHPFTIEAAVILPEHLHAIWTLPERRGFCPALAPDQKSLLTRSAARRTGLRQPRRQRRARDLATMVLGAYAA